MAITGGGPPNLEGIKYFDLMFCPVHLLTKPNICAKFEQNRLFELYHLLPGFLMDTLLKILTTSPCSFNISMQQFFNGDLSDMCIPWLARCRLSSFVSDNWDSTILAVS